MRVVLVNPPILLPMVFAHYPMFSTLGLLTNAGWLRKLGWDVRVVDAFSLTPRLNLREEADGFRHVGAELDTLLPAVLEAVGDSDSVTIIVGLTMFSEMNRRHEILVPKTLDRIRAALPKVSLGMADMHVCGMNYFPYDAQETLKACPQADWMAIGEGEPTLPAILERLQAGDSLEGLPRVASRREDSSIAYNPQAPEALGKLDDLPLPAFDLLNMDNYFQVQADAIEADLVHEYHVVERLLPFMTSRSCPFRCSFCTNQVLALPWRSHSVDYLFDAFKELKERYSIDRFLFLDDNINVKGDRFRDLTMGLAQQGIAWDAINGYRADLLDRETIRAIKAAGNTKITVSAESGDPEMLRTRIRKKLKLSTVVNVAKMCEEERIPLQVHFIMGVPGETRKQINKTLEFATVLFEKHGAWPLLQHAIPFPGTKLYQECEENDYFIAPPDEVPGSLMEVQSIIHTPEFNPGQILRMKRSAQHLHVAMQTLVHLKIESRCDNACSSCHCAGRPQEAPSREKLSSELERQHFFGGRHLFLGGGEPTMREDLSQIIAEARELGYERVTLITNAHGFASAARAKPILEAGIDSVVVELHGASPEIHDDCCGRERALAYTLKGLRTLQAQDDIGLDVSIPVTRKNLDYLERTVSLARQLGAQSIHLQIPSPDSPAFEQGLVVPWEQLGPRLLRVLGSAPKGLVSIQGAPLCLLKERKGAIIPLPPWELQRTHPHKAKIPTCMECVDYTHCGGFRAHQYQDSYGTMAAAGLDPGGQQSVGEGS